MYVTVNVTVDVLCTCLLRNCYVTVYVPDYVTIICVLGSGTNEGSSPRSGRGRPLSLVPTHPRKTRGVIAVRRSLGEYILCRYNSRTVL